MMKVFFDISKKKAGKVASKLTGKVAKDIAIKAAKANEKVQKMLEAKQASYSERNFMTNSTLPNNQFKTPETGHKRC